MDPNIFNKKLYLLDGSFISGVTPYVDVDSVMKHPLWGSNLLFNAEEAVVNAHRDYIRGRLYYCFHNKQIMFHTRTYLTAGAEFLTTNTYQANIGGFNKYLDLNHEQSFELIKKSVTICRRAIMEENCGKQSSILRVLNNS